MNKILAMIGLSLALLLAPIEASSAVRVPDLPTGGWVSVETARTGVMGGIAKYWDRSLKNKVCRAYRIKPRKATRIVSRIFTREGFYPKRNVRKGTRQALRLVC